MSRVLLKVFLLSAIFYQILCIYCTLFIYVDEIVILHKNTICLIFDVLFFGFNEIFGNVQ